MDERLISLCTINTCRAEHDSSKFKSLSGTCSLIVVNCRSLESKKLLIDLHHMIQISLLVWNLGSHLRSLIMKCFHLVILFTEEISLMAMERYSLSAVVVT